MQLFKRLGFALMAIALPGGSCLGAENLISNPSMIPYDDGNILQVLQAGEPGPEHWSIGTEDGSVIDSRFMVGANEENNRSGLGIAAGRDRQGVWSTNLPACEPGVAYRFEAEFFKDKRSESSAYPEVRIWGKSYKLDTHRMYGRYQPLHVHVQCPGGISGDLSTFSFMNMYAGTAFWMRNPVLIRKDQSQIAIQPPPRIGFFPIAVYGGEADDLPALKKLGLNSAVVGFDRQHITACRESGLHCTLLALQNPDTLQLKLDQWEDVLAPEHFSFYVNDEPGIHSFPRDTAAKIQRIIKERYPRSFTNMAVVRPQVIPDYMEGADYFMLDQYPVPHMPMTWLSDSMDEAAEYVGRNRLQAVIQAFGGERWAHGGWPRMVTFEEMNCLAFLAVIHGARGLYFYTYQAIKASEQGVKDFTSVIRRLNSLRSWLLVVNEEGPVDLEMTSVNRFDPQGRPAVHCSLKEQHGTQMLMCVNTIRTYVEAAVPVLEKRSLEWEEYFTGETNLVVDGKLHERFDPLEVRVLMEKK